MKNWKFISGSLVSGAPFNLFLGEWGFSKTVPLLFLVLLLLTGCGEKKRPTTHVPAPPPDVSQREPVEPKSPIKAEPATGHVEVAPFPDDAPVLWSETGMASWYGPPYHNRRGANGEVFDMNALTAAHLTLPLNSYVRVTNLKTDHSVIVRITDRGPFVTDRIIDLSKAAAQAVDVWRPGTAKVRLDVLYTPSAIADGGRWCVQIGAIKDEQTALDLKGELKEKYKDAKVLEFRSPVGDHWVRVRVSHDDKETASTIAGETTVPEGNVFLVRLD
jgi:rare lipoprotein A